MYFSFCTSLKKKKRLREYFIITFCRIRGREKILCIKNTYIFIITDKSRFKMKETIESPQWRSSEPTTCYISLFANLSGSTGIATKCRGRRKNLHRERKGNIPKIRISSEFALPEFHRTVGRRRFVITPKSVSFLSLHISVEMEDGNSKKCRCVVLYLIFFHLLRKKKNQKKK